MDKIMDKAKVLTVTLAAVLLLSASGAWAEEPIKGESLTLGAAVSADELDGERGMSGIAVAIAEQETEQKNANILAGGDNMQINNGEISLSDGAITGNRMSVNIMNTGNNVNYVVNNMMNVSIYGDGD